VKHNRPAHVVTVESDVKGL